MKSIRYMDSNWKIPILGQERDWNVGSCSMSYSALLIDAQIKTLYSHTSGPVESRENANKRDSKATL